MGVSLETWPFVKKVWYEQIATTSFREMKSEMEQKSHKRNALYASFRGNLPSTLTIDKFATAFENHQRSTAYSLPLFKNLFGS